MASKQCWFAVLTLATAVFGFTTLFTLSGPMSVQSLIQAPRCDVNASADSNATCCDTCLGFSPVRYNLYLAIAFWITLPLPLAMGYLLDRFGVPRCALGTASGCLLAGVLRLIGVLTGDWPNLCFAIMAIAEIVMSAAVNFMLIIVFYIAGHYFPTRLRPVANALAYSVSTAGVTATFFTVLPFGERFGLTAAYGLVLATSLVTLAAAVVICVCDRKLSAPAPTSDPGADAADEKQRLQPSPAQAAPARSFCADVVHRLRGACGVRLVFLFLAGFSMHGDVLPWTANSVLLLVDKFGVDAVTAAIYTAVLFIAILVVSPAVGLVLGRYGHHEVAIALGGCLSAAGLLLMNFAHSLHPLVSIVLFGAGEAAANPNIPVMASTVVPPSSLGVTMALISAFASLGIGVGSTLTGLFVQKLETRAKGWTAALLYYAAVSGLMVCSGLTLIALRWCCEARQRPDTAGDGEEEEQAGEETKI